MSAKKTPAKIKVEGREPSRSITREGVEELDRLLYYVAGLGKLIASEPDADIQEVTIDRRELKEVLDSISKKVLSVYDSVHGPLSDAAGGAQ